MFLFGHLIRRDFLVDALYEGGCGDISDPGHVDLVAFIGEAFLREAQPDAARSARTPAVVKDHHDCLPKPMDRSFYLKCGAMLRRARTRSAAAMLAGRRCARGQAVTDRRSVGDVDRELTVAETS